MSLCDNVAAFADGELSTKEADAFHVHLADCEPCQKELEWTMVLMAQISCLVPEFTWRWSWLWMRWEVR